MYIFFLLVFFQHFILHLFFHPFFFKQPKLFCITFVYFVHYLFIGWHLFDYVISKFLLFFSKLNMLLIFFLTFYFLMCFFLSVHFFLNVCVLPVLTILEGTFSCFFLLHCLFIYYLFLSVSFLAMCFPFLNATSTFCTSVFYTFMYF